MAARARQRFSPLQQFFDGSGLQLFSWVPGQKGEA